MADSRYDVFLSYNTEERSSVLQIARHLRDAAKLRPWFDQWHAIPGISVSDNLKQGLETSETCAVFIGRSGEGPWQKSEIRKAIERQKQKSMLRVIPVLLPDAPDELDTSLFLLEYTWVDFRGKNLNDDETLWRLECGIRGVVPGSGRPDPAKDSSIANSKEYAGAPTFPGMSPEAYFKILQAQSQPQLTLPQPQKTPKRQTRYWAIIMFFILAMTLGIGGWIMLPKPRPVRPDQEDTPTPTIAPTQKAVATPTKQPESTPTPAPTSTPLSVTSCWDNETPGATCKEETAGMEFVYVPKGCFQMGSNDYSSEKPGHQVCLNGFWMGKYEVTQTQWETVMKKNPSRFKGVDRPVEEVSWNDVQEFLQKLNAAVVGAGSEPAPTIFRLPSEAEWEYAARAGTQTAYSFGDDPAQLDKYAWYSGNSGSQTHPVGQKQPNDFGLYDMHGNVWEWCQDLYAIYSDTPKDGSAYISGGSNRVLRGGS